MARDPVDLVQVPLPRQTLNEWAKMAHASTVRQEGKKMTSWIVSLGMV